MKKISKVIIPITAGIIGFGLGMIFEKRINKRKTSYAGVLRIDKSEEDEPEKLFLELDQDLNAINKAKNIVLRVVRENYISQQ